METKIKSDIEMVEKTEQEIETESSIANDEQTNAQNQKSRSNSVKSVKSNKYLNDQPMATTENDEQTPQLAKEPEEY